MWRRLALAALIEIALGAIALQGGPHGSVGPWSWTVQLPGLLILFVPPVGTWMPLRLVLVFVVQWSLWFAALSLAARAFRRIQDGAILDRTREHREPGAEMRLIGSIVAVLPLAFGAIRAATTGTDFRYMVVGIVSTLAAGLMVAVARRAKDPSPGIAVRMAFAVFAAAGAAGMCAFALGGGSAPAVVMVAGGFALCSGVGLTLAAGA